MAENGYCPSGRLFEAAACGTALASDWWPGLEDFLQPGRDLVVARQPADVLAALEMPDAERDRIARNGRERVLSDHTSERRAEQLERLLEQACVPQLAAAE
jgi:spore maturation protein CgeB